MKITEVRIKGFRNIRDTAIKLNDEVSVLIGDNGHGKSNFIDAVEFAVNFILADRNMKKCMLAETAIIPYHKKIKKDSFFVDLMMQGMIEDKAFDINYGFELLWPKANAAGRITREWLNVREGSKSKKYTKLIDRDGKAVYKSSRTGRCSTEMKTPDDELVLNRLMYAEDLFYADLVDALNHLSITVIRPEDMLTFEYISPAGFDTAGDWKLESVYDLPQFMYLLKVNNPNLFSYILSGMQTQFEDIKGIDAHCTDLSDIYGFSSDKIEIGSCYLTVQKENYSQPLDYKNLSKGELYSLYLMARYALAELRGDALIAIDEPENSIHPKQYSAHAQTIAPITMDDRSVLIASHSPFLVQYFDSEDYYIGNPHSGGIADFTRIDRRKIGKLKKDARRYGETPGVYVYDLLSGDDDEIQKLVDYLELPE